MSEQAIFTGLTLSFQLSVSIATHVSDRYLASFNRTGLSNPVRL